MADLSITAANVGIGASAKLVTGTAGEAITRGQAVYYDSATKKYMKAVNDASGTAAVVGVAQSEAAADGDYIIIQKSGGILPGATMTKGQLYYLSATAGGICPFADLIAADYVTSVYRATSTTEAELDLNASGILL